MKFYEITSKPYLKLRIFATLIDYAIYYALFWIYILNLSTTDSSGQITLTYGISPLFLLWIFYFPGTEAINGATPGHDILKLMVVKTDGSKSGFWDALKRRVCDPLDIFMYGIPAMICISKTEKHQRIGDLLAGTQVVKKSDITEKEISFR
jgi:uncharacterized RDD family membrane protein YckC